MSGVTSPTTINQQTITGTREADTAILCNGTQVVASGSSTNWSYAQALTNGWNYFAFTARDAAGNMSEATDVAILYNDVAPEAVTVTGAVYGVGTRLTLGWAGYNELAAGAISRLTTFSSRPTASPMFRRRSRSGRAGRVRRALW